MLTNRQCVIEREFEGERVFIAINADEQAYTAYFDAGASKAIDLITGDEHIFGNGNELPAYSAFIWKCE